MTTMPKTLPTLLSIALLALAAPAAAQPAPPPAIPAAEPAPAPADAPPPVVDPEPTPMADPEEPADEPAPPDDDRDDEPDDEPDRDDERDPAPRPDGMTIGLGAGYRLPAQLDTPNVVSARLRLNARFTVEPTLELSRSSQTNEFDGVEATSTTGTYAFGASLRTAVASRGRNDLILVGAANLVRRELDPDGDINSSSLTTLRLDWGLAIDTWIAPWLAVSATATNPLVTVIDRTFDDEFGERSESETDFGAIWDPSLAVMVHLFW